MSNEESEQYLRLVGDDELQLEENVMITDIVFTALEELQASDIPEIQAGAKMTHKLLKQKRSSVKLEILHEAKPGEKHPLTAISDKRIVKKGKWSIQRTIVIYAPPLFSTQPHEVLHGDAIECLYYDFIPSVVALSVLQDKEENLSLQHPLAGSLRDVYKFALQKQRDELHAIELRNKDTIPSIIFPQGDPRQKLEEEELLLRMGPILYYADTSFSEVQRQARRLLVLKNTPSSAQGLLENLVSISPSWNLLSRFAHTRTYESEERYDILSSYVRLFPEISIFYEEPLDESEEQFKQFSPEKRAEMSAKYILYRKMGLDLDI